MQARRLLALAIMSWFVTTTADDVLVYRADEPGVTPPSLVRHVPPDWPPGVQHGTQARVRLRARIAADGSVVAVNVVDATDSRFSEEARRSVSLSRYSPGRKDGRPVDVVIDVTVRWKGRGANLTAAILHAPPPVNPEALLDERRDGEVEIEVRVGTDGRPKALRVLRSDDPRFTAPAIDAIRQWTFDPAWANDEPVESTERVTVPFSWREGRKQIKRKQREAEAGDGTEGR